VRPYTPADLPRLEQLYADAWPGDLERKMAAFRWIEEQNPFRDPDNQYLVFDRGEEIIGYWGRMPTRLHVDGEVLPAGFSQETLVSPSARRQGVARRLGAAVEAAPLPLLSLWHNEKMHAIMTRAGWQEVGRYRVLKKVYRLTGLIRREEGNRPLMARALRLVDPVVRRIVRAPDRKSGGIEVEEIHRFGAEMDELFARISPKLGVVAERSARILNWKYVDIPHRSFRILGARTPGGALAGYMVIDIEDVPPFRRGTAVDLMADPDVPEVATALAARADRIFEEEEVDLAVVLTSDPSWIRTFRRQRFFRARPTETSSLLVRNVSGRLAEAAHDLDRWYLTFGDSDGHMW